MNYYPHHIGDFNSATRHLSRVERSIYRDMIEMYYDTEQPLPLDRAALCRKLMARSEEESTAVQQVLNEFFTETEQGWINGRCDKEIEAYHKKLMDKSKAGKASAATRAAAKTPSKPASNKDSSTAVQQVLPSCSTNQEPITNNQEPSLKPIPPAPKSLEIVYPAEFEAAWGLYPRHAGASKKDSLKAWNARLKAGVSAEVMTAGVMRYSTYVRTMQTEERFMKQPETFFGPAEHYLNDWHATPSKSAAKQSRHVGFDKVNYSEGVTDDGRI